MRMKTDPGYNNNKDTCIFQPKFGSGSTFFADLETRIKVGNRISVIRSRFKFTNTARVYLPLHGELHPTGESVEASWLGKIFIDRSVGI